MYGGHGIIIHGLPYIFFIFFIFIFIINENLITIQSNNEIQGKGWSVTQMGHPIYFVWEGVVTQRNPRLKSMKKP